MVFRINNVILNDDGDSTPVWQYNGAFTTFRDQPWLNVVAIIVGIPCDAYRISFAYLIMFNSVSLLSDDVK